MGCCASHSPASDVDSLELQSSAEISMHARLEEMALLTESSAETADEPFACFAALRQRIIVFRAGVKHNITDDVDQFKATAAAQQPPMLARDQKKVSEWTTDVLHIVAASPAEVVCPATMFEVLWKERRRRRAEQAQRRLAESANGRYMEGGGGDLSTGDTPHRRPGGPGSDTWPVPTSSSYTHDADRQNSTTSAATAHFAGQGSLASSSTGTFTTEARHGRGSLRPGSASQSGRIHRGAPTNSGLTTPTAAAAGQGATTSGTVTPREAEASPAANGSDLRDASVTTVALCLPPNSGPLATYVELARRFARADAAAHGRTWSEASPSRVPSVSGAPATALAATAAAAAAARAGAGAGAGGGVNLGNTSSRSSLQDTTSSVDFVGSRSPAGTDDIAPSGHGGTAGRVAGRSRKNPSSRAAAAAAAAHRGGQRATGGPTPRTREEIAAAARARRARSRAGPFSQTSVSVTVSESSENEASDEGVQNYFSNPSATNHRMSPAPEEIVLGGPAGRQNASSSSASLPMAHYPHQHHQPSQRHGPRSQMQMQTHRSSGGAVAQHQRR